MIKQRKLLAAMNALQLLMKDSLSNNDRLVVYAAAYNSVLDDLRTFYNYPVNEDDRIFDIIGGYSGAVIGTCQGYDSIFSVLSEEPNATFRRSKTK